MEDKINCEQMKQKVVIFGAGLAGSRLIRHLTKSDENEILFVLDNNTEKHNTLLHGYIILSPLALRDHTYDRIIIASTYHREIFEQLTVKMGISPDVIETAEMAAVKGNVNLEEDNKRALARELMAGAASALEKAGIRYHIDHGTLLGLYRDGDLMPWDNDIDIAIHADDQSAAEEVMYDFASSFSSRYCRINRWKCRSKRGLIDIKGTLEEHVRILKIENTPEEELSSNLQLDIILKHPREGMLYWLVDRITLSAPEHHMLKRQYIEFCGQKLSIPGDIENYLTALYNDWKTPRKKWDHTQFSNISSLKTSYSDNSAFDFKHPNRLAAARDLLLSLCNCMAEEGLHYHIDKGTLLGIYRDKELISWDKNLNLAINADDLNKAKEILTRFCNTYQTDCSGRSTWDLLEIKSIMAINDNCQERSTALHIEPIFEHAFMEPLRAIIHLKYIVKDRCHWHANDRNLITPARYLQNISWLNFANTSLPVPKNSERYLKLLYGEWQKPVPAIMKENLLQK